MVSESSLCSIDADPKRVVSAKPQGRTATPSGFKFEKPKREVRKGSYYKFQTTQTDHISLMT
jgi:hypothetical protein